MAIVKHIQHFFNWLDIGRFKKNREVLTFFVCFVIATFFWFLNALSKSYTTIIEHSVRYVDVPDDKVLVSELPSTLRLKVTAFGFSLLRNSLSISQSPIIVNVGNILSKEDIDQVTVEVMSEELLESISSQIDQELTLEEIRPEVIEFSFDKVVTKSIDIRPDVKVHFGSQVVFRNSPSTEPKTVLITGPKSVVDTIDYIKTQFQEYRGVDHDIVRNVKLEDLNGVELSTQRVVLNLDVEKFTEAEILVPLTVINAPDTVSVVTFPRNITVLYRVGVSYFKLISDSSFVAEVDWNKVTDRSKYMSVDIGTLSPHILSFSISPKEVEFAVEK